MEGPKDGGDQSRKSRQKNTGYNYPEFRMVPVEAMDGDKTTVDLLSVAKTIWESRNIVYIVVGIALVIGLLVAFLTPVEYQANATLMPELQNDGSSLADLLQQYGGSLNRSSLDLGNSDQPVINAMLYPDIIKSTPFMLQLMNQKVHSVDYDTTVTVFSYFNKIYSPLSSEIFKYTIGLPGLIKKMGQSSSVSDAADTSGGSFNLSDAKDRVMTNLRERMTARYNNQSGIIAISSVMPEPKMSAVVTKSTIALLKDYVTKYRTQKSKENYDFIKAQYEEAKDRFQQAQDTLTSFQDAHLNPTTGREKTQLKRLQYQYNLAYNVWNGLAQQMEQTRILVQQNKPFFKVLEPATVPKDKLEPQRFIILVASLAVGLIAGIVIVIFFKMILVTERVEGNGVIR